MDYQDKSIEELETLLRERQEQKEALRGQMRQITAALDAKRAEETLEAKLADLSPAEREALARRAQTVGVEGIGSGDALGVVGAG